MKVIYIQDQEINSFGGLYFHSKSEHFFERYLTGLSDKDTLTVCCGIVPETDPEVIRKYKCVSTPRIRYVQIPDFRRLSNIFKIFSIVKEQVKNANFCYLRSGIASSVAGYYCRKKGIPYMAILNEDVFKNLWNHPKKTFKLFAFPLSWMTSRMVRKANYACYVTQQYLQKRYPCRGKLCGCSDIEFLDIDERNLSAREKRIDSITRPYEIGSIGSLTAKLKGQDTVIRTLAYLKQKGITDYRYHLVGQGSPNILKRLADNLNVADLVVFEGEFSHDDVLKWFEECDIYIHPSHSEGLPRTIIEAMTKATPCICSNVGGIPELISEDWLFDYNGNETEELANLIVRMDKASMRREAKANFEKSKAYNPDMLERTRRLFFEKAIETAR